MTEVIMPKMGDGMEEGTLIEWLVKEGDTVKSGDVIGTIQSDKATLELEAPGKGTFKGALIQSGDTVPVGQAIAAILKDGEDLPAGWGDGAASAPAKTDDKKGADEYEADQPRDGEVPEELEPEEKPASADETTSEVKEGNKAADAKQSKGRAKASPLAKKIAQEKGIDLADVKGSGPGGRIVEKDVLAASKKPEVRLSTAAQTQAAPEDKKVKLNVLRGIIAERTQHAKQTVPHFYVSLDVDLEKIETLREAFKVEEAGKVSINDFVVRACVLALQDMPVVNSTFKEDHLLQFGAVNIGVAAAVPDGLLVPVLHNAHLMGLREISGQVRELVGKARDGKLTPNEMQGSTFSISNMGMLNVDSFSAIINEPNAAIVAISSARKKVVVNDEDELEVRLRMTITGSFDHRVVDGAVGAQFMNVVREYLENPMRLLS